MFPALFTAGMTLVDTTDSVLMTGAYGWAFVKPVRKLYYNLTITFVSVVVAVVIGGVRGARPHRRASSRCTAACGTSSASINDSFGMLGFLIIGIFVASWLVSMLVYRLKGYDLIETAPASAQSNPA